MDFGTFFFANITSVTVFTVCMCTLAWNNRAVKGMQWLAGAMVVGLLKLILQGLEGKVPIIVSSMLPNELYLIATVLHLVVVHWFVAGKPMAYRWPFFPVGAVFVVYTAMYLGRVPYGANVVNIPNVLVCGLSAWILLKRGRAAVTRLAAVVLCGQAIVMAYRAVLTQLRISRPWESVRPQKWLYSLAILAFLATCTVMCDLWLLVTELGRELDLQALAWQTPVPQIL